MGLFGRLWGKSRDGEASGAEAPPAGGAPDHAGLDVRVATLLTDFEQGRFGLGPTGAVDYPTCRDAVLELHGEVEDEESRIALIRFHGALMSSGVAGLQREGRDPSDLEALWREDYFIMLTKEVIGPGGEVDQHAVDRVNRREKEAGRLGDDETFQVQLAVPPETRQEDGVPTARFVGERAVTLWTVVLRSIAPHQRGTLLNAFAAEGSRDWLTEAELNFLVNEQPDQEEFVAFGWQAERLAVLLWSLGLSELPAHDAKCDPIAFAPLVPPTSQVPFETFLAGLRLRDRAEIEAVAHDISQSYWAAHAAVADGLEMPPGADLEILGERLHAAAWLVGQKVADWP